MKRNLFILASVACVLAGCTLEPAESQLNSEAPVFTASYAESGATRTQLADNQTSVLWSEGDEISLFDGNGTNHEYVSSGPGKVTEFSLKGSGTVEPASTWHALYPYDPDAQPSPHSAEFWTVLKNEFSISAPGTFAEGMNLAIAQTGDASLNLSFKNVLSYICVAVKGASDVTKITFRGNNEEVVSGAISIPYDLSAIHFSPRSGIPVYNTLTLNIQNFEESASRESAKYYYIPVIPGFAFQKGFSIDVTKGDGDYTYTYDQVITFTRGEKRALFIEIPGGGDDRFIPLEDLTDGKVLQWTVYPHQDVNADWTNSGILYPDTYADIAKAQWEWDPNAATYPTSSTYEKQTPIFADGHDKDKDINMVHGPWKDHSLVFTVPVASVPAGKSIVLNFMFQCGRYVPKGWTVEISLDGNTWTTMNVSGGDPAYVNQTLQEKDSTSGEPYDLTAPFIFLNENATPQIEASYPLVFAISDAVIKLRIRALTYMIAGSKGSVTPTYKFDPQFHSSYTRLYLSEKNFSHPGPYITIR